MYGSGACSKTKRRKGLKKLKKFESHSMLVLNWPLHLQSHPLRYIHWNFAGNFYGMVPPRSYAPGSRRSLGLLVSLICEWLVCGWPPVSLCWEPESQGNLTNRNRPTFYQSWSKFFTLHKSSFRWGFRLWTSKHLAQKLNWRKLGKIEMKPKNLFKTTQNEECELDSRNNSVL